MKKILTILLTLTFAVAYAQPKTLHYSRPYPCRVVEVHDGDTVVLDTFLGKGIWEHSEAHRLFGIDTAEIATSDGQTTTSCMKEILQAGDVCYITLVATRDGKEQRDKYGRWLCQIYDQYGNNLNEFLIRNGLAKPYYGGKKP